MLPYTILLWVEYGVCGAAVLAASAWLGRRIDRAAFAVCLALPVIFLLPSFSGHCTQLPLDQVRFIGPWNEGRWLPPRNPYLGDVATQMLPWNKAVRMACKEGSFPWRDRWNGCGTPLLGNGQSAPLSPFTLLGLPLPMLLAFALGGALKLFLCLTGMWLWLRELSLSKGAALFGAISFAFSLAMTPWILFPHTGVICLWPWALFAVELMRDRNLSGRAFLLLVAVITVWPLQGHLESVMSWTAFTVLWLVARILARDLRDGGRIASRVALAGLLALGLSAFALLPHVRAILASNRFVLARSPFWASSFSWRPHGPVWTTSLYTAFFPRSLGDGVKSPMLPVFRGGGLPFPEMAVAYFGIVGWAIALLLVRPGSRRARAEWCLVPVAFIGWAAAVALWPFVEIVGQIPALKMMFPLRFLVWVAFAGSAVAAFEIDRLAQDLEERRRSILWLCLSATVISVLGVLTYFRFRAQHLASGGLMSQQTALAVSLALLGILALVGLWGASVRGRFHVTSSALTGAVILLGAAELFYQGMRLYGLSSPLDLYPDTPLTRFLKVQQGVFRVAAPKYFEFPNTNVFAGVEDIRTHDPVERRDYVEFLDATCGYAPADYVKVIRNADAPVLDFLNVRFLVTPPGRPTLGPKWRSVYSGPDGGVMENGDVLPRVIVPGTIRRVPPAQSPGPFGLRNANAAFGAAFSEIVATRDWSAIGYVLSGDKPETAANGRAEIRDIRETTNTLSFRSSAGSDTLAVASVTNDGGWSARDERGSRLEVLHADGPFLAVELPAGEHTVTLAYRPPGLAAGGAISFATLAGIILTWLLRRRAPAGAPHRG